MGWYRLVHAKSVPCKDSRALLVGRKLLQGKLLDVELSIRGILRGYGLKVGEVSRGRFEVRIRELIAGHVTLETVIGAMLVARMALWNEFTKLHREMLKIARADKICRRLMSHPASVLWLPDISLGGGRSGAVRKIQYGRRLFRAHAKKINQARQIEMVVSAKSAIPWCELHSLKQPYHADACDPLFELKRWALRWRNGAA